MPPRLLLRQLALLTGFGVSLAASTAPTAENKIPLSLPDYQVWADRPLPPPETWYYARIDGFEVLSDASEGDTRRVLQEFVRFTHALNLVWPGMSPDNTAPATLIICGHHQKFAGFLPESLRQLPRQPLAFSRRRQDKGTLVVDQTMKFLAATSPGDSATPTAAGTAPSDDPTTSTPDLGYAIDTNQQMNREYIRFLFSGIQPPLQPWLSEGLAQLFMNLTITETEISVGRIEDPNITSDRTDLTVREDQQFSAALGQRSLQPLEQMFTVQSGTNTTENVIDNAWAKQCYAFVHWGLYGDYGRNQKSFLTFIARLQREPLTETLFQECFKLSYRNALHALRTHIEKTRAKIAGVRANPGEKIPAPPIVTVRPATEAEIGRLQATTHELAEHTEEAHDALVLAYRRGDRDPALLAALGLAERQRGETDRARKFLEAAVARQAPQSRAYLALARLRLDEYLAHPAGDRGRLAPAQLASVLEPLFAARPLSPHLPGLYTAIAEVWTASATPPTAAQLAVLDEGVRRFPSDAPLLLRTAELKLAAGRPEEARALVQLGLQIAPDAATRTRFEQLRATLPPAAKK